ncbi:cation transporter [Ornithinibacillus sp. BX22]|uniref:Cation transporter n=2 Tax=Ornithinibacillus TaxID=484508 RepID=A0A923L514_9BACI|nr:MULTISPECIES: cation diffusion facilitator family transporter [Ornithinibacillus]MBC5636599.1 cation transporter [Ornithinibacillus hominis]MBS3680559.1 cation transporter [Ornithinibacillus massiliensis]
MNQPNIKGGEKGAWISIFAYLFLSATKLLIGHIGDSDALWADGLNNSTDIVASIAILIGLRISQKPPDHNHRYGHYRAETIASLLAAFIMVAVGLQVIFATVGNMFGDNATKPDLLTAWTAIASAIIMYIVYRYNLSLSRKVNSSALYAASQDNRSDALVSIGAFIGIIGAQFGIYWLDPLAGLIVGLIICKTAWGIFKESTLSLTDAFDEERLQKIKQEIKTFPEVKIVPDIKGRALGNQSVLDVTIKVDPNLTVIQSHDITVRIEKKLANEYGILYTHIHIEPYIN